MEEIIVNDSLELEKKRKAIGVGGTSRLHVLADFDQTLTRLFVGDIPVPSLVSILYNGNYLTPDYSEKSKKLHEKYYALEVDPSLLKGEKEKAMDEWWRGQFKLLIDSKLNRKDVEAVVKSGKVKLRDGIKEFLDTLEKNNIPLIIMSSSGLGGEAIYDFLKFEGKLSNNIHIISNEFIWDSNGFAVSIKEPIIHSMNKAEVSLQKFPEVIRLVKERDNILLLGNSPDDATMAEGSGYVNLLKIGFLNNQVQENLPAYRNLYDVVITNDGSLNYINSLLAEWCG